MLPIFMPLIAVFLPIAVMLRMRKKPVRRPWLYSLISFTACSATAWQEIQTLGLRAVHGDISGILDTWMAVLIICVILTIATLAVNFFLLWIAFEQAKENKKEQS